MIPPSGGSAGRRIRHFDTRLDEIMLTIGLDIGTSSVKGALVSVTDGGHEVSATATEAVSYHVSRVAPGTPGYTGYGADDLYGSVCAVIRRLIESADENVAAAAIASASGNTVLAGENGEPLCDAFSWTSPPVPEEYGRYFGDIDEDEVYARCGWPISAAFPPGHLALVAAHAPELIASAAKVTMTTEYILKRLTGEWMTDRSTATPSYLCDQRSGKWMPEMYERVGVKGSQLPRVGETGDIVGTLTPEAAAETGLTASCRAVLGSFDHPSAARGNGIVRQGQLLLSCGTSWVVFVPVDDRGTVIKERLLCDPFLTGKGGEGPWGAMFSLESAAVKINHIVEKYISSAPDRFARLDALSLAADREAHGLKIDVTKDLPDLSDKDPSDIARALMLGVSDLLKARLDALDRTAGLRFSSAAMAGGPSSSPVWRQTLGEVLGIEVTAAAGAYSGAVGAALTAAKGLS